MSTILKGSSHLGSRAVRLLYSTYDNGLDTSQPLGSIGVQATGADAAGKVIANFSGLPGVFIGISLLFSVERFIAGTNLASLWQITNSRAGVMVISKATYWKIDLLRGSSLLRKRMSQKRWLRIVFEMRTNGHDEVYAIRKRILGKSANCAAQVSPNPRSMALK